MSKPSESALKAAREIWPDGQESHRFDGPPGVSLDGIISRYQLEVAQRIDLAAAEAHGPLLQKARLLARLALRQEEFADHRAVPEAARELLALLPEEPKP